MGNMKFDRPKPLFKNKAFYIALIVSLIALGTFSYVAINKLNQLDQPTAPTPTPLVSFSETDHSVSDVPYPQPLTEPDTLTAPKEEVPVEAPSFFTMPVTGTILKNYDEQSLQYSETYQDWRIHLGVDIAANRGSTVFASATGVVEDIYEDPALGVVMAIDHGQGMIAYYCGLDHVTTVQIGDSVESGTQIGTVDMIPCESIEQSHLHFAVEVDGQPVSPLETMGLTR